MFLLNYVENSDAGVKTSNCLFISKDKATEEMVEAFEKSNAIMQWVETLPPIGAGDPREDQVGEELWVSHAEDGIAVTDGIDTFTWRIETITPEDEKEGQ